MKEFEKQKHFLMDVFKSQAYIPMKKKDLEQLAGITHYQMCKLANDKDVTTDVIGAICAALNVRSDEIMDFIPDEKDSCVLDRAIKRQQREV